MNYGKRMAFYLYTDGHWGDGKQYILLALNPLRIRDLRYKCTRIAYTNSFHRLKISEIVKYPLG